MDKIKNIKFVILFLGILLILVVVRSLNSNVFRKDVKTALEESLNSRNLISIDQLNNSDLVVILENDELPDSLRTNHTIRIPFENMLDKANRKKLEAVEGNLILYSADAATAAKAWVILNQLGFKHVSVLNTDSNQEHLKYKFQPDTTVRLEQDSI